MKKLLLFISLILILYGCGKSSTVKPTINLAGTYVSYKEVDTIYNGFIIADGIWSINIYTSSEDSLYNNPGTANANHYFGPPYNNSFNAAATAQDTITFNSSSTATETRTSYVPVYITYNLKGGTFDDGLLGERERIVAINDNTVELITNPTSVDNQPNTTGYMAAIYYRKR